jgi:hypothetical protein
MYSNRELVESGAAWLDAVKPGWEGLIDLAKFDISDGKFCICGQVFLDDWREALIQDASLRALTPYGYSSRELDFESGVLINPNAADEAFSPFLAGGASSAHDLAEEWVAFIKERYSSGTLSDNA